DEVFRLETRGSGSLRRSNARSTKTPVVAAIIPPTLPRCVAVPHVQPQRPVLSEHPPHFGEHLDHSRHVGFWRRLQTELTGHAVISQSPIRRAGDAALDGAVRQSPKDLQAVTAVELDAHHRSQLKLWMRASPRSGLRPRTVIRSSFRISLGCRYRCRPRPGCGRTGRRRPAAQGEETDPYDRGDRRLCWL